MLHTAPLAFLGFLLLATAPQPTAEAPYGVLLAPGRVFTYEVSHEFFVQPMECKKDAYKLTTRHVVEKVVPLDGGYVVQMKYTSKPKVDCEDVLWSGSGQRWIGVTAKGLYQFEKMPDAETFRKATLGDPMIPAQAPPQPLKDEDDYVMEGKVVDGKALTCHSITAEDYEDIDGGEVLMSQDKIETCYDPTRWLVYYDASTTSDHAQATLKSIKGGKPARGGEAVRR